MLPGVATASLQIRLWTPHTLHGDGDMSGVQQRSLWHDHPSPPQIPAVNLLSKTPLARGRHRPSQHPSQRIHLRSPARPPPPPPPPPASLCPSLSLSLPSPRFAVDSQTRGTVYLQALYRGPTGILPQPPRSELVDTAGTILELIEKGRSLNQQRTLEITRLAMMEARLVQHSCQGILLSPINFRPQTSPRKKAMRQRNPAWLAGWF